MDKAEKKDINSKKISRKNYEAELKKLQVELIKLQEWIKQEKLKVVVIFEGRDAAGKGGTIKRIIQVLNPRICKVVALGTPPNAKKHNGIFNVMLLICRQREKWYYSTEAGITGPELKK